MKILQICLFCILPFLIFGQENNYENHIPNKTFRNFRDYLIAAENIEDLQKKVANTPPAPNSIQYLNSQIAIELRKQNWDDSMNIQKTKQLIQLATKQKSLPDLAMAYFILGRHYSYEKEDSLSYDYLVKAEKIFTKNNDTTGMLFCFRQFRFVAKENYKDLAKLYFDKLISLSLKSSNPIDKYFYYLSMMSADPYFDKQPSSNQLQEAFKKAIELVDKYPYCEFMRKIIYQNFQQGYTYLNKHEKALEVSLQTIQDPKIKVDYMDYQNLGRNYIRVKKYDDAIVALEKANKEVKIVSPTNYRRQRNIAKLLKTAYYNVGNLKASIKADEEFDRLNEIIFESDRSLAMFHLREKYSFEDKVAELKRLALEKEVAEGRNKLLQSQYEAEKREANLKSVMLAKTAAENRNKLLQAQVNLSKNKNVIKTLALERQVEQSEKRRLIGGLLAATALIFIIGFLFLKLRKTNSELLILQKSREKLYTIIAHDLRSPVSTFQRYSDIVAYLVKTKQFVRLDTTTKQIDQIGRNLAKLLNNLLAWSLSQQGFIKNTPESVGAKAFFQELLPIYHDMANLSSLIIIENIEDTKIVLDPNKFALIIRNMLDNAIKFSEENNTITISATRQGNDFLVTITNKSRPSTIHQKQALKELFESDKDYLIGENKNLGVGSILVKQYAKIMGSKITFDYDIDCLTIFTFSLPLTTNI